MAIKGQQLKKEIQTKILTAFPGSFLYNDGKEIRICGDENGENLQIKCVLSWAKTNVEPNGDMATPGDFPPPVNTAPTADTSQPVAPSEEEKATVSALLRKLGL